jgi:tetratricopeptide (TPR) repeat protein
MSAATTNRYEEAVEAFSRIDFTRGWYNEWWSSAIMFYASSLHMLGRYRDELALARRLREQHPSEPAACISVLTAMAPRSSLAELTRALTDCISQGGVVDSAHVAQARLEAAQELRSHGRPADAVQFVGPAVEWNRQNAHGRPDSTYRRIQLGLALLEIGAWQEALEVWEPMARARPNNQPPRFAANAGIAAARVGRTALAEEMLERLSAQQGLVRFQRARVLAHLGRKDEAIEELQRAIAKGVSAAELFHRNVGLDPLRGLPAFEAFFQPRK